jgi:hypothetical protein
MTKPEAAPSADSGEPHYLGHRERLRDRFRKGGADALGEYELPRAHSVSRHAPAVSGHFKSFNIK